MINNRVFALAMTCKAGSSLRLSPELESKLDEDENNQRQMKRFSGPRSRARSKERDPDTASVEGGTGDSLAEAGQVLHHLGDERESARCALGRVFLHQVEERRGHDGRAHEAEEQGGADQAVGQVLPAALGTSGPPRGEDFLQLPRKYAGGGKEGKN